MTEQLIANCNDCKKVSIFEINEDQDPFYVNGKRLRECIRCGRYEEASAQRVEDPADRDDRLYHEEQDHIAMGIAKENTNESK